MSKPVKRGPPRVVSVGFNVVDREKAQALYDAMRDSGSVIGLAPTWVATGNYADEVERLSDLLGECVEFLQSSLGDSEAEALLDKIEASDKAAMERVW